MSGLNPDSELLSAFITGYVTATSPPQVKPESLASEDSSFDFCDSSSRTRGLPKVSSSKTKDFLEGSSSRTEDFLEGSSSKTKDFLENSSSKIKDFLCSSPSQSPLSSIILKMLGLEQVLCTLDDDGTKDLGVE